MSALIANGSVVAGYRIVRLVGRGATGSVYLAVGADGREIALKVLSPELARDARFRERFLRAPQVAAALDEPHVVPTLAMGEIGDTAYLVMPYIDGPDLRAILRRDGALPVERAVELVGQVASALDAAHALGLVHRDVKPGNVLVVSSDAGEHAFLCDFGLAEQASSAGSATGERALVGTIAYVSPEQIEGGAIDARADVYSLGCLLFECLTGEAPFARESEVAVVYAHMHEPPPRASDLQRELPAGIDAVVEKALAKSPADRYASCGELAAAAAAALRGELPRRPRRRVRAALGVSAAFALLAVAAVAAILHAGSGGTSAGRLRVAPATLGLIDPRTHAVVGRIAFASQPWDVAFDRRAAWVLLGDERQVARVDLASQRVLSSVRLPFSPGGITTGDGSAWVTEDGGPGLVRLSGTTARIARTFSIAIRGDRQASPTGIAFGAGSLWVARGAETVRVDPRAGLVIRRIPTPLAATSVVFADGAVWVASAENGRVVKIDPATDRITASTALHGTITDLAVDRASVWVSIVPDDVVYRLSPDDGSVLSTIPAGPSPSTLSVGDGLWIADARGRQIVGVDAAGRRQVLATTGAPWMARYHDGLLWASVGAPAPVVSAEVGRTLRIALAGNSIGNADPAAHGGPVYRQLAYSTCPYLLNYPDAAGAAGRTLRPEVAAGQPGVSPDGRTYTFRIRPGFRFSPPSGQRVTAETFRFSIERALSPQLVGAGRTSPAAAGLADVVGVHAFTTGTAAHIRGITVRGDTLTVRLLHASGDLPAHLRSSFFCPVPVGTPAVAGGGASTPIAMAGPYYVASTAGDSIVLERNPAYTGSRPRRVARIVYTAGIVADDAIARIEDGRADYLNGDTVGYDAAGPLAPGGALDRSFGPASRTARTGGVRYLLSPAAGVDGVAFNTRRPLFRSARVRRAVAYALDRPALAAVYGEQPSDRLVPVAVGGQRGNIAYPDAPDPRVARRLAGLAGRHSATLYFCGDPSSGHIADIIRANLAPIGIDVHAERSLGCLTGPETSRLAAADLQLVSHFDDVADPAAFVEVTLGDPYSAPGYWTDAALRARIERARSTRGAARLAAYARLESVLVRDAVPVAVYASAVTPELVAARVGCMITQGALGVADLGALCLRA